MTNAERLLEALAPTLGDNERDVDAKLIGEIVAAIAAIGAPTLSGSMTADSSFTVEFDDVAGMRAAWTDWLDAFARVRIEFESVEELGDNVVIMVSQTGTTRHGVELTQPSAAVWKFDRGLVARVEFHLDRAAAMASAAEPL
jgi:ketosteroid isomerase-like protein